MAIVEFYDYGFSYHSGERYGEWNKSHSYEFSGFVHLNDKDFSISGERGIAVPPETKSGDILYFVWVSYDTGDSLVCETDAMCDIGLYKSKDQAERIKSAIEKDSKKKDTSTVIVDDEKISTSTWKGYFEKFNDCNIEELEVK